MDLRERRTGDSDGDGWPARDIVPCKRAWHVVARAGDELPPTARLFLTHLVPAGDAAPGDCFRLVEGP